MIHAALYLAGEADNRRERVGVDERLSLLVNASLVLLALAAVLTVAALVGRERQLTKILQRRIDEEAALREAAEALLSPPGAFAVVDGRP